jgi:hypothetical protein
MEKLHAFYKAAGKGVPHARSTAATFHKYEGKPDEALLQEWREHGWCSYAGDLLFAGPKGIGYLDVHHGSLVKFEDFGKNVNLTIFMVLGMKPYLTNGALDGTLTRKALKIFGNLASDEMFTFEPAPALGGGYQLK